MIRSEIEKKIGKNISELIDDGSCLQLEIGALPDALAFFLRDRRDLGIYTELFSACVLDLMRMVVVTGANKKIDESELLHLSCSKPRISMNTLISTAVF